MGRLFERCQLRSGDDESEQRLLPSCNVSLTIVLTGSGTGEKG